MSLYIVKQTIERVFSYIQVKLPGYIIQVFKNEVNLFL